MTALAEFWGGFSVPLKNFGGFTVFGDSLRPPLKEILTQGKKDKALVLVKQSLKDVLN